MLRKVSGKPQKVPKKSTQEIPKKSVLQMLLRAKVPKKSTQENTKKEPFNKTARAILNSIIVQTTLTREMLAEQLGLSDSTVKKYLKIFKDLGLIDRVGPNKGGYWEVKK